MKIFTTVLTTILFLVSRSYSATIQMTIMGDYSSDASSSIANSSWKAVFTYETLLPEDQIVGIHYSAITSATFTISGDTYQGLPGKLGSLGGITLTGDPYAPAGTYAQVSDSSYADRMEFRSRLYLDGNSMNQDIEIFEIVFEDRSSHSLWSSTALPDSLDSSKIDYTSFATRFGSSSLDFGTITSVATSIVPEPSTFLMLLSSITFLLVRRSRISGKEQVF